MSAGHDEWAAGIARDERSADAAIVSAAIIGIAPEASNFDRQDELGYLVEKVSSSSEYLASVLMHTGGSIVAALNRLTAAIENLGKK